MSEGIPREGIIRRSFIGRLIPEVQDRVADMSDLLEAAFLAGFDAGPSEDEPYNLTQASGLLEDLRDVLAMGREILTSWDNSYGESSDQLREAVARVCEDLGDRVPDLAGAIEEEKEIGADDPMQANEPD